jgi:hypothetical protein
MPPAAPKTSALIWRPNSAVTGKVWNRWPRDFSGNATYQELGKHLARSEFATRCKRHFFSLPGQLTTNEKLCAFGVSGAVFAKNRPSGATS